MTMMDKAIPAKSDFISDHRELYLRSGGTRGHIMELPAASRHWFTTHCMIKYTGRKSRRVFITPLIYGAIGGEVVIVASNGGSARHPAWYANIRELREVEFQVATEAFVGTWREPVGNERTKVWNFMVDVFPGYTAYQASIERQIPLVMMRPFKRIESFKEADATGTRCS
jgi:deazaflavin-dependent oxidoreductase (nitroreductase family)